MRTPMVLPSSVLILTPVDEWTLGAQDDLVTHMEDKHPGNAAADDRAFNGPDDGADDGAATGPANVEIGPQSTTRVRPQKERWVSGHPSPRKIHR